MSHRSKTINCIFFFAKDFSSDVEELYEVNADDVDSLSNDIRKTNATNIALLHILNVLGKKFKTNIPFNTSSSSPSIDEKERKNRNDNPSNTSNAKIQSSIVRNDSNKIKERGPKLGKKVVENMEIRSNGYSKCNTGNDIVMENTNDYGKTIVFEC